MEVDCKNEAIVKCIEEDGRVGVDIDSFSTEAVENMAEGTEDVNMLAGITVDTHDTEDVITDNEGITVDTATEGRDGIIEGTGGRTDW